MQSKAETLHSRHGFTMVEVLVSLAVLALLGTAAVGGLLAANRMAVKSRLATNAQAIAQARIDRILSEPWPEGSPAPPSLAVGITTETNVPIYTDPVPNTVIVSGTVSTAITDVSRTIVPGQPAPPLIAANVTVAYTVGGTPTSVSLSTVRTAD